MPCPRSKPPRALRAVLSLATLMLLLSSSASAHSALKSSSPEAGGTVDEPTDRLTLIFDQQIDVLSDSVALVGPDGTPLPSEAPALAGDGVTVTVALGSALPAGTSTVLWRVIGEDGHPIEGSYTITSAVAPPGPAEPAESTEAANSADHAGVAAPPPSESSSPGPTSTAPTPPVADAPAAAAPSQTTTPPTHAAGTADTTSIESPEAEDEDAADQDAAVTAAPIAGEPPAPEILQTVGRWAAFSGLLIAMGVVVFGIAVHPDSRGDQMVLSRLAAIAAISIIVGSTAQVLGHVAVIGGDGLTSAFDPEAWRIVTGSGLMISTLLRLGGASILLLAVWRYPDWSHDPNHGAPMIVGALALLLSFQFTGHTATSTPTLVVRIADLVHVASGAVWTGGVIALAAVMRARHHRDEGSSLVVGRFSVAATVAVVLVGIAGLALAVVELSSPRQLVATSYGLILLAKLAIVAVIGAVGAYNHTRLVPAIITGDGHATARMRRTMLVELALFPVAIGLTAALVRLSP